MATRTIENNIILRAIGSVLLMPLYGFVALIAALFVLSLLIWIFHLPELFYVINLPGFPLSEKLLFGLSGYTNTLLFIHEPLVFTRVVFSLLAGMSVALYVFIRKHEQTVKARKGLGGFAAALLGSGCIVCGTSLLSPVLGSTAAFASASLSTALGVAANAIGIMLMLYSLQGLGKRAAYELVRGM